MAGRVAAAAAAFGASGPPLPRPPPRRAPSSEEQESSVNKLTTQKVSDLRYIMWELCSLRAEIRRRRRIVREGYVLFFAQLYRKQVGDTSSSRPSYTLRFPPEDVQLPAATEPDELYCIACT